jgi:hypothetical protein
MPAAVEHHLVASARDDTAARIDELDRPPVPARGIEVWPNDTSNVRSPSGGIDDGQRQAPSRICHERASPGQRFADRARHVVGLEDDRAIGRRRAGPGRATDHGDEGQANARDSGQTPQSGARALKSHLNSPARAPALNGRLSRSSHSRCDPTSRRSRPCGRCDRQTPSLGSGRCCNRPCSRTVLPNRRR